MNAVVAFSKSQHRHNHPPIAGPGTASIAVIEKERGQRNGHPAKNRKGSKAANGKSYERQQEKLIAACMPNLAAGKVPVKDVKTVEPGQSTYEQKRRRVVHALPTLPAELVADDSPILRAIDSLDFAIVHGKKANPAGIKAVEAVRTTIKSHCKFYEPVPVANMTKDGRDLPFLSDGKGLLCASGTPGFAVFNGRACTKVCRVSCTDNAFGEEVPASSPAFVALESLMASIPDAPGL